MKNRAAVIRQRGFGRLCRYALEAALTYTAYGFFRLLPLDAASAVGGCLMRAVGPRLVRTRDVVLPQLEMAFPDLSAQERIAIMRDMWDNMGRVFAEYSHLDHMAERITVVGQEHLEAARASGRPLIFYTAHIGNWEVASVVAAAFNVPLNIVYRAPNNPWVESLLARVRRSGAGGEGIAKGADGARQILSVLRKGGAVGLLVDQRLTGAPLIPFFGRPALTLPSVHLFARKFGARVHAVHVERLKGAHFRVTIHPESSVDADQTAFLTKMNAEVESWIRLHPAQWLWTHRRWG